MGNGRKYIEWQVEDNPDLYIVLYEQITFYVSIYLKTEGNIVDSKIPRRMKSLTKVVFMHF